MDRKGSAVFGLNIIIIGEKYCFNIILLKCAGIGKEMGREMDVKIWRSIGTGSAVCKGATSLGRAVVSRLGPGPSSILA
jgi:hypothetical protein